MNKFVYDLLKQRYLWEWRFDNKIVTETPEQMILRVSKKVQSQYLHFCKHKNKECYNVIIEKQKIFYHLIKSGDFVPSSPQIFNQMRGFSSNFDEKDKYKIIYKPIDDMTSKEWDMINDFTNPKQAFGSCYSFGRIDDSIESIYTYLWEQQETFRAGGGYGVSFSNLRENGQYVKSIGGSSCGPIEFMRLFNLNTKLIQLHQKTKRGQNMFSLSIYHPDIEEFIDRKTEFIKDRDLYGETYRPKYLEHQNISVEIDNNFIKQLKEDKEIELISPSTKKVIKKVKQKKLWDKIIYNNWKTADPGILNFDIMNQKNPLKDIEPIVSTNPCVIGDTKVLTLRGLVNAKDLNESDYVYSDISQKFIKIEKVFNNGIKSIKKIVLSNGLELNATLEHKVFLENGKKIQVKDLNIGDKIQVILKNVSDKITNDKVYDEDISWIMGYFLGNGTYSQYSKYKRLTFTVNKQHIDIINKIERILKKYGNYVIHNNDLHNVVHIQTYKGNKLIEIIGKEQVKNPNKILKSIKGNKVFPEYIFTSSKEEMLSFLAGYLDSDGTINIGDKQRQGVSISSTRKDFLQNTQLLLTLFGVYSSIKSSNKPSNFYDKNYNKIYNSNNINYRLLISQSTINNLKGIENYLSVNYKKQDFIKIIESNHYNKNFSILEVTSIENQEPQEVFDITVPPDFIWITNGIKSYDCQEYIGFPYTVCNLGSVNLWNMIDKKNNKIDLEKLQETTELQTEYLNYALWQNEYPLKKLTERSRQYRPIGLGFMGLASVFVYLGYRYGDDNSKQITKEIIEEMMYHTIKKSNELVPIMGTFEHYDKSTFKNGKFYFKNEKYNDDIKKLLSNGVVNSRFMSIAPTGSISLIAQGLSSKDQSSISGGIEPIFALSYKRQVNPNTDKQYLIDQNDISLIPTLKKLGLNNDEIKLQIDSLNSKKRDKIFNDDRFRTSQELSYEEHLSILEIVSHQIDMSISKTINVPNETTPEEISKIYLDFIERDIQGGTIYRDGSRQQILKEVKQKEKDKEDKKKINLFMSDLSFNKKGKIEPKKRPVLMEQIKKTIKMKNGDKYLIFHIDVGFAEDAEPFEVFIRQTQSTKEYTEMFNQIGRLVSLQFRSNLSIDETLNQIKKVKNWKNEYSPIQKTIVDTINEIINVRKLKGKKKEQLIDKINEKAGWIRTPKGYYIDNDGKMRCPICNGEVIAHDGCYSCKNGDWNQCS